MIIRQLLFAYILLVFSICVLADDRDDGKACGGQRERTEAFKACSRLAQKGDKAAQFNLSLYYDRGEGVAIDKAKALYWVRKAAEQGLLEAELGLGQRLMTDEWGAKDMAQASKWLRLAADKGNADAQYWLGQLYRLGQGIEKDLSQSISWYRKSAEQGNAYAQYWAGLELVDRDNHKIRNYEEGAKWLKLAAQQNIVLANVALGQQYEKGEGVPQDYSIAYSQYLKAAEAGEPLAMYKVGAMLYVGRGVSKDHTKAFDWLNKAVKLEFDGEAKSDAFYKMSLMYLFGSGVERNHQNALKMLRKSVASGESLSKNFLEFIDNQSKYSSIDPRILVDMSKSDEKFLDAVGLINKDSSGFLISKCHVLTARHSVFGQPNDYRSEKQYPVELERLKKVSFDVGQIEDPPYKKYESTGVVIDFVEFQFRNTPVLGRWAKIFDGTVDDWALIKLKKLSDGTYPGDKIKPFCFYKSESELIPSEKWNGLSVRVVGQPLEKILQTGNSLLWQDKDCKVLRSDGVTTCTARPGMSGGPLLLNQQGEFKGCWQPIGILIEKGKSGFTSLDKDSSNYFVPLDLSKYKRIQKAMDENPCN